MKEIDRREFLGAAAAAGVAISAMGTSTLAGRATQSFELEEATIADMRAMMDKGEITAAQLTDMYLKRIASVDKQINSIIEVNPDARKIAAERDRERKDGKPLGPLHGIPVVLKDNIDTADRMKTTAGSLALLSAPVPKNDAHLVEKLREAGAVILAKANLSEWANFRSTESVSGWSGRGGQTRNPYMLDRNPCGSSSGSAAATASNLAAAAIGTETDGSIVCPASICGVVGLKPTVGLVSRSGIIPIAHSQDTAGPMTRTVMDAAIMLNAIQGADPRDPVTSQLDDRPAVDYTELLKPVGLKGVRIGVARDYWGRRPEVDEVSNKALDVLKKAGAELIDFKFPTIGKFRAAEFEVLLYEFKAGLEKYLAERGGEHKTLAELIEFNSDNASREMPYFKQEIFEQAAAKGSLESKEYKDALELCQRLSRTEGIDAVMHDHNLDAIVAPTNAPTWLIDFVNGDCGSNYVSSSSFAAVSGYPSITVPAGFVKELPIGVSFFGKAWSEAMLLRVAYAFEQGSKARRKPKFLATAK
ncbi:amidase [soil metagenome]